MYLEYENGINNWNHALFLIHEQFWWGLQNFNSKNFKKTYRALHWLYFFSYCSQNIHLQVASEFCKIFSRIIWEFRWEEQHRINVFYVYWNENSYHLGRQHQLLLVPYWRLKIYKSILSNLVIRNVLIRNKLVIRNFLQITNPFIRCDQNWAFHSIAALNLAVIVELRLIWAALNLAYHNSALA